MGLKESYEKAKAKLLTDKNICRENRALWKEFFEWQERKLKRTNNLSKLDNATYKTLNYYIGRFKNVNKWFNNKAWVNLSREDIQEVYDDLEDGVIKNRYGKRFKDRKSYYTKVFKSKPFKMAGKAEIAEEVFEFYKPNENSDVNFIEYQDFLRLIVPTKTVQQRLLLWLAWDIGENVGSLLQIRKKDFRRQLNPQSKEPEYLIDLRKEILKRSRRARVEITNFIETAELLDVVLQNIGEDDKVFNFGHRQALKFISHCSSAANVKCIPSGKNPTYKDLRNSMCCHLLKIGWRIEEVNSRLGHSPANLSMVTRYANYLALDRHKSKLKVSDNNIEIMRENLNNYRQIEKRQCLRIDEQQDQIALLEKDREKTNELIKELMVKIAGLQTCLNNQDQQRQNNSMGFVMAGSVGHSSQSNL